MNRHGMSEDLALMKTLMGSSKMFQWLWLKVLQSWFCVCVLVIQLCPTLWDPWTVGTPSFLCPWDSPGKNTRVGCHFLLQGIFLTQG